ncbi:hypothetical protein M501DRAFT_1012777 [Patellaria atrata CBS 101060]|uniref:BTB domain-containing protein n=1 Tax=Patellaria atrata CBS 101060 TaxID=1346257 RepID=A0A9P4SJI1_9PEZI|nr:hypothetical protein M501DRAFT_1012777 [Patellaria atrata CBS 101060]
MLRETIRARHRNEDLTQDASQVNEAEDPDELEGPVDSSETVMPDIEYPFKLPAEDRFTESDIPKLDANTVTICVGKEDKEFEVPKSFIPHLSRQIYDDEDIEPCLKRKEYHRFPPATFRYVAEFLKSGDYTPPLRGEDAESRYLEGVSGENQMVTAFRNSVKIFEIAAEMLLQDLINLVAEKIQYDKVVSGTSSQAHAAHLLHGNPALWRRRADYEARLTQLHCRSI